MLTGSEIRAMFLKFFEERGHQIMPSASLIPYNDPSILWTAAGMVPFKPYFTGAAVPDVKRATTCQKCLRTPDIEVVGKTARHHTFFEMLGNFSFGSYFKEKAIPWAWEFITAYLKLPQDKLWVTIYLDDDEAYEIWRNQVGVPADRIVRLGKDTNFWEIGVGPCGPCSEIYIDLGEERGCHSPECQVGCDCDRYLEIWNLVFIQYFRDENGNYSPLKSKGIDTGMGLERVTSVLQGVATNFDTDIFRELMDFTAGITGNKYGQDDKTDLALKVIADHCRAVTFAVSDGVLPGNEGRGYVIRRLLRRAVRFGRVLGVHEPFLYQVAGAVVKQMGGSYPDLVQRQEHVLKVIRSEEERFLETLAQGSDLIARLVEEAKAAGLQEISGQDAFRLYDTFGFPLELTKEIAEENDLQVDEDGFTAAMEEQRERARGARQEVDYISERNVVFKALREELGATHFVGYSQLKAKANVLALLKDGLQELSAGPGEEVEFILDVTPCYAESGGQVTDYAKMLGQDLEVEVYSVTKPVENLYVHRGKVVSGIFRRHDEVWVEVDRARRRQIARNHSATHLLHKALKQVLGEHVNQAGSLVEPDRLRFDFTHYAAVTPEELDRVEALVNQAILDNLPIEVTETSLAKAKSLGATALFGEKYGKTVRVVKMGDYSMELCGGTHLTATAEAGLFKLVSETSVGSGLRRIEAVTGQGVLDYLAAKEAQLSEVSRMVKAPAHEVVRRVEAVMAQQKVLSDEVDSLRAKLAKYEVQDILARVREVNGVKVLSASVAAPHMDALRNMVDLLRDRLDSGVILLGSAAGDKVNLVAAVTKDLHGRGLHAGNLVKAVAKLVGGGGGGRPDLAQAGGKEPAKLPEAVEKVYSLVQQQIK